MYIVTRELVYIYSNTHARARALPSLEGSGVGSREGSCRLFPLSAT